MFYALGQYGIETGLNEDVINKVNDYFKPIKQKTAYEIYRCDWSSDVCSSDLRRNPIPKRP